MSKKKTNRIETIEQIDYGLKADNKLPPDKLYPKTEQNKQKKETTLSRKNAKTGKKNANGFEGDKDSKKSNLEKTEKIKSAIKKFLSLRSL